MLFPQDTTDSCPADRQSSDRSVLWRKRQTLSHSTSHQPPESHPSPVGEGDGPLLNSAQEIEMKHVWLLWCSDTEKPWIENIFIDKVLAESALRRLKDTDDGRGYLYWIQEKEITE